MLGVNLSIWPNSPAATWDTAVPMLFALLLAGRPITLNSQLIRKAD